MAEQKDSPSGEERLSDAELSALREQLHSNQADSRAFGAVTIQDVAEASGVSREEVAEHLRRIRAEKAFSESAKPRSRVPVWPVVAVGVVVLAFAAWKMLRVVPEDGSNPAADLLESRIQQNQAEHPGPVSYIKDAKALPPPGCRLRLESGENAIELAARDDVPPLIPETAHIRMLDCLQELLDAAHSNPHFSDPKSPTKVKLIYRFGSGGFNPSPLQIRPEPGQSQADFDAALKTKLSRIAQIFIPRPPRQYADASHPNYLSMPPTGYQVDVSIAEFATPETKLLIVYPLEDQYRNQLIDFITRTFARAASPVSFNPNAPPKRPEPLPAMVHIVIKGPLDKLEFDVPGSPSAQYPTAADVLRTRQETVEKMAAVAAKQLTTLHDRLLKG